MKFDDGSSLRGGRVARPCPVHHRRAWIREYERKRQHDRHTACSHPAVSPSRFNRVRDSSRAEVNAALHRERKSQGPCFHSCFTREWKQWNCKEQEQTAIDRRLGRRGRTGQVVYLPPAVSGGGAIRQHSDYLSSSPRCSDSALRPPSHAPSPVLPRARAPCPRKGRGPQQQQRGPPRALTGVHKASTTWPIR